MSDPTNPNDLPEFVHTVGGGSGILALLGLGLSRMWNGNDKVLTELKEFRQEVKTELKELSGSFDTRFKELEARVRFLEAEANRARGFDSGIRKIGE